MNEETVHSKLISLNLWRSSTGGGPWVEAHKAHALIQKGGFVVFARRGQNKCLAFQQKAFNEHHLVRSFRFYDAKQKSYDHIHIITFPVHNSYTLNRLVILLFCVHAYVLFVNQQ
jgi:hypothetical protein